MTTDQPRRFRLTSTSFDEDVVLASEYDKIVEALRDAYDHLEYTGYGDSWERECALEENIPDRLSKILEETV